MDFHNMKRKQLQALCKKHKISANLTNVEMANNLSSLLKRKEEGKCVTRGRSCLKRVDVENVRESESDVVNKKVKKVRFSPENETFEFVRSDVKFGENKRGGRRRSVLCKVSLADEIVENVIDIGRVTRSSRKKLEEGGVVETKKGRKSAKNDCRGEGKVLDEGNVDVVDVDEGEGRVNTRRPLRNKGKMDEGKHENVGVDLGKRRGKTRNMDQGNAEGEKEVLEIDKVVESQKVLRRSKRNAQEGEDSSVLSANANENEVVGKGRSRRTKKVVVIEASKVEIESEIEAEVDGRKRLEPVVHVEEPENAELRRSSRRKSVIPSLDKISNGKAMREKENILQLEEAPKIPPRRSNRQKSAKPAVGKVGNDARNRKHTSELEVEPDFVVSREEKKIPQLYANIRRSKRETGPFKSAIMTNETIENNKLMKQSREPRRRKEELQIRDDLRRSKRNAARHEPPTTREGKNGNLNAAQKQELSKRRRDQNVEEEAAVTRGDPVERVPKQSTGEASRSYKAEARVSPAAPNQPLEERVRHDKPVALNSPFTRAKKQSFLVEGSSYKCHEEPAGQDDNVDFKNVAERAANAAPSSIEVVMDNFAESSANQHLSNIEGVTASTIEDTEKSGQKSHQENHDSHEGTGAGNCYVEEAKGLEFANLEEGSPTMPVDEPTHHTDVEMTENENISLEINIEKSPENCILNDNEEKQKGQPTISLEDFTSNHLVEPQCLTELESPKGADSAEATSAINSNSFIDNSDSLLYKLAAKLLGRETVDEPSASKATHSSSLAVGHVDEDDGVSVHKEPMLEPESTQRFAPPVIVGNTTKDLGDDIENGFEKDEEAGDQDEDEKECGTACRVDEEKRISAEKEHLHKPEENRSAGPISSDHVDEGLFDSSYHSMGSGEKSENAFHEDGEAGVIASPGRDRVSPHIQKETHEEDPENTEEVEAEVVTETENVSGLPQSEYIVELTNSEDFEKLLEKRDQCGQRDDIEADKIGQADGVSDHKEQNLAELVEYDEAGCLKDIKDEHGAPSAHDPSERISGDMLWDAKTNDPESSLEPADMQRTISVSPDVAAKFSQGNATESEFSSSSFSFTRMSQFKANSVLEHQEIGIGSERTGDIHSLEVEVSQMEGTPAIVQKDGSEGSNSCMEVDKILDDSNAQPITEEMGKKHHSASMGDELKEKERQENCLREGSQPFRPGQYSTDGPETLPSSIVTSEAPGVVADVLPFIHTPVKDSSNEEQGEQLRNLFATPLGVSKMMEEKEIFSNNSVRTGEALAKGRTISLAEDIGSFVSTEASNEDVQEIRIGSERKGDIHSLEVEVSQMKGTPAIVQKDGSEGSNSCMEVDKIMDDSNALPITEEMGNKHHSASMGDEMREKERHENCLREGSQPFRHGQYSTNGPETLPSSSATPEAPGVVADVLPFIRTLVKHSSNKEQGEQLRNLFATPLGVSKMMEEKEIFSDNSERTGEALAKGRTISLAEDSGSSVSTEASNEDVQEIGIGSEGKGDRHSLEVEVTQMEGAPVTVQKDSSEGSNSCMEVDKLLDDSNAVPITEEMGNKHHSASMGDEMREKERHENCLREGSQPFRPGQYSTDGPETVPSSSATPEGEQLRNLFATPHGVSKMMEEKEISSNNSERTGEALAKGRTISLAEDSGSSVSTEASNEVVQGEQLRNLFATPLSVSKTTEEKECFRGNSEKAGEAFSREIPDVCNASPNNSKEIYDDNSSKLWQENDARNLFSTPINSTISEMKNEIPKHGAEMTEPPMSLEETLANVGSGEVVPEKGSQYKKCIVEKKIMLTSDQVLNASPGVAWPEDQLRELFATPVQSIAHCKEGETLSCGRKADDAISSGTSVNAANDKVLKRFEPQELLGQLECGSEKVIENSTTIRKMAEDAMSSETSVSAANDKVLKRFEPQELLGQLECGSEKVIENSTTLRKMAEDAMSSETSVSAANDKVLKRFEPQELLGELECGSDKVIENNTTLASNDGNIIKEVLDEANGDLAVNISTFGIFSEDVSENYEVSKEQMTADLETMVTGIEFITGGKNVDMILSSGTISPNKEATDHHSKCEETTPVTSVNDLNEAGQPRVKMSHDIFDKSEARISHNRKMAPTSTVQEKCVIPLHPADGTKVGQHDVLEAEETSEDEQPDFHLNVAEVELNAEEKERNAVVTANEPICSYGSSIGSLGSVECGDQDNAASLLSNPYREDDEVRKESDRKTLRNEDVDDNVVAGANADCIIRILEVLKEQATNIDEAQGKHGFVGVTFSQELVMHISDDGIQQEMIKECGSPYDVHESSPLAEDKPTAVDAVSQLLGGFEMNVIPAENEDNEMVMQLSSTNSLCHHSEEAEEIKESSNHMLTGEQSVLSELQMKGKDADLSSNFFGASDLSVSEDHEVLKESEVAAAIKEYIDSEPNENVNNSGVKNHIDAVKNAGEWNVTEHANFVEPQGGSDVKPSDDVGESDKPSVEEECEGRQYTMERKEGSPDLVTSRGLVAEETLMSERLDAVAEKGKRFSAMERNSTAKMNVRTILIHGTPMKADMKENAPASKREQMGSLTTVRPAKRRALEDLTRK